MNKNSAALPVLYYNQLDYKAVQKNFDKVLGSLVSGDFRSADVKKIGNTGYYRARLNIRDRLLFTFVNCNKQRYLLLLEVILNHEYSRSRFLRGALLPAEDDMQPVEDLTGVKAEDCKNIHHVNSAEGVIHVLNKFISFDDTQKETLYLHPPLIIIGAAGSGKTVVVLEKLKTFKGSVAYISLSNFLVENARRIYYSNGYDGEGNEAEFLSFEQYIQSWKVPEGKEINFRAFEQWFNRHAQQVKISEPYRLYEEFKGVLTGSPVNSAWLSKEAYLTLGIKQSIFPASIRDQVYVLFTKYLQWMKENDYYDSNILSFHYLNLVKPRYDYVVIDEVQDITSIQLKCIMQSLIHKNNFMLTGDSNQIVHPNFFSWSKIKTYLYNEDTVGKQIRLLQTNYRNSNAVVQLSNTLLKIKNLRFGSIDRESNYLINTVSGEQGHITLLPDDDKSKSELNRNTQDSTHYAVIIKDNKDKEYARRHFKTPLVFSVQEVKGLEYENVILLNFISTNPVEFKEIVNGVNIDDLGNESLGYSRAADKSDKDAEVYKFYINALYVAITRAIRNVIIVEKEVSHPCLALLSLQPSKHGVQVEARKSDKQEWLNEASRLEEQGKYEQAEQIRAKYLGYEYVNPQQLEEIKALALDPLKKEAEVKKERKQLFQYAQNHHRTDWIEQLARLQFQRATLYMKELKHDAKEYAKNCRLGRSQEVDRIVKKYGVNFTTPDTSVTGIMLSLHHGQDSLTNYFLENKANISDPVNSGLLPVDYLLLGYYKNVIFRHTFTAGKSTLLRYWFLVKPAALALRVYDRRIVVGSNSMLFFLLVCMRCMEKEISQKVMVKYADDAKAPLVTGVFSMDAIMKYIECVPDEVLPVYRKQRPYVNANLSLHELGRKDASCKMLFMRVSRGCYIINPDVAFV